MERRTERSENSSKMNEFIGNRYDEYKKSSSSSSRDEKYSYEYRHMERSRDRNSRSSSRSYHYNNIDSCDKHYISRKNLKRSSSEDSNEDMRNRRQVKRSKVNRYTDSYQEKYKSSKYRNIEHRGPMKRSKHDVHREKEYYKSPRSYRRSHYSRDRIANESDEERKYKRHRRSHSKSTKSGRSSKNTESHIPISPVSICDVSKSDHSEHCSETKSNSPSTSRSDSRTKSATSRSGSISSSYLSLPKVRSPYVIRDLSPISEPETVDMELNVLVNSEPIEIKDSTRDEIVYSSDDDEPFGIKDSTRDEIVNSSDDDEKLPPYYPGLQGCRSVEEYKCLNRVAEGTYGVVFRAQDMHTKEIVALKRFKMEHEKEGFPITSLREINTLLKSQHPNIVTVREIVVGNSIDKIFIVMDFVEHDLSSLMDTMRKKSQYFLPSHVKCLTQQLLRAVAHLHDNWIIHRDLKTSNLLLSHNGILKVGDFGLAREYGSPVKPYTPVVVTQWYRAPELLLCCKIYSTPIDMWSVGCIFAEFLHMCALFPGKSEIDQLNIIFKLLGTPNEEVWPEFNEFPAVKMGVIETFTKYPKSNVDVKFGRSTSDSGRDLLRGLLAYDPKQRYSAEKALDSMYFTESPLPIDPEMLPTFPAKSEMGAPVDICKPKQSYEMQLTMEANLNAKTDQNDMGPGFILKF